MKLGYLAIRTEHICEEVNYLLRILVVQRRSPIRFKMTAFATNLRVIIFQNHSSRIHSRIRPRNVSSCAHGVKPGKVYLVGSGPAGIDHLTFRAARLISTADVLVVDAVR